MTFFSRNPSRRNTRHRCWVLIQRPLYFSISACSWRNVRSLLSPSNRANSVSLTWLLGPGRCRRRATCPLRLRTAEIFHAQAQLTPKRPANSARLPWPRSCASNNFCRKSSEYARAISYSYGHEKSPSRLYTIGRNALGAINRPKSTSRSQIVSTTVTCFCACRCGRAVLLPTVSKVTTLTPPFP